MGATAFEDKTPTRLRSYTLRGEPNVDATIIQAALATSAATSFFKPVTIGAGRYVDGALGSNNPIWQVWDEAQSIWSRIDGEIEPKIKCIVSIGTGNPGASSVGENVKDVFKALTNIVTETEVTAEDFAAHHRGLLHKTRYFRYNVEQGLQAVGLEEYQKQAEIEAATRTYLKSQTQKFNIMNCANNLSMKYCMENFS